MIYTYICFTNIDLWKIKQKKTHGEVTLILQLH